jgi:hypothetical protein
MATKKKKPTVLPLPPPPSKQAKPKKKKKKPKTVMPNYFYVIVTESGMYKNVDEFKTLDEALRHIDENILPDYCEEVPTSDDVMVIQGNIIELDYDVIIKARKA